MRRVVGMVVTAALAASVLGSVAVTRQAVADEDQQDTYWHYIDDPRLEGPSKWWWPGTSGGWDGDYHFTYGIGGDHARDNYAVWEMGHRHGKQTIYIWVPKSPATVGATVLYRIYENDVLLTSVQVDQEADENKGWNRLGAWDFNGAEVRVEIWDNETRERYDRNNPTDSRIGIDTVAMRCWSRCWDDSEERSDTEVAVLQDSPTLYDEFGSYSWWANDGGYNGGYHWTYSSGGISVVDNWGRFGTWGAYTGHIGLKYTFLRIRPMQAATLSTTS